MPGKLVDAETLESVISMLNDQGVAVYEQTPDAEQLLNNTTTQAPANEEEAEEAAEAALERSGAFKQRAASRGSQ